MKLSHCRSCIHEEYEYCNQHGKSCIYVRNCKDYEEDNDGSGYSPWPNEDDPDGDDQPNNILYLNMINKKNAKNLFKEVEDILDDFIGSDGWSIWERFIGRESAEMTIVIESDYYLDDDSQECQDLYDALKDACWNWGGGIDWIGNGIRIGMYDDN